MKKNKTITILICLILIITGLYLNSKIAGSKENEKSSISEINNEFINEKLKSLEENISAIKKNKNKQKMASKKSTGLNSDNQEQHSIEQYNSDIAKTIEQNDKETVAQIDRQIEFLNNKIDTEEQDPEWSANAEYELDSIYTGENVTIVDTTCGTTACRMEMVINNPTSVDESFYEISNNIPWDAQGFLQIDTDDATGSSNVLMFIARGGHGLQEKI